MRWTLGLLLFVGLAASHLPAAESRPNIVFLLADDLAAGAVGYSGNTDVITPQIDRLAREGVRFMRHYDTTAICMASRASLMTGLYEYRHGCNFDHGDLERRFFEQAYPVLLRQAGYFTGFAGKIGLVLQDEPFEVLGREFDIWAGGPGQTFYETAKNEGIAGYAQQYPHCSRAYGAWGQDFFRAAKASGKPFCMSISFKAPHLPDTPDPLDMKLYQGKSFTRPANHGVERAAHLSPQAKTSRAFLTGARWAEDAFFDETASKYYALITGVDAALGMIREALEREGLADNTVIIFTSDNGYNCGSHGFADKVIPYEEGSKAPLIIYDPRLPGSQQGQASQALTANVDLPATILALAGVPAPAGIDGQSLLPLLANPLQSIREQLPLFNFWGQPSARSLAVVTPQWKYIYWFWAEEMLPTEELFDLQADPGEMKNLASDSASGPILERLRGHYDDQLDAIANRAFPGRNYETHANLFDRRLPWSAKIEVARRQRASASEDDSDSKKKKRATDRSAKKSRPRSESKEIAYSMPQFVWAIIKEIYFAN
jgi:arylsulfatase A-like enzyme